MPYGTSYTAARNSTHRLPSASTAPRVRYAGDIFSQPVQESLPYICETDPTAYCVMWPGRRPGSATVEEVCSSPTKPTKRHVVQWPPVQRIHLLHTLLHRRPEGTTGATRQGQVVRRHRKIDSACAAGPPTPQSAVALASLTHPPRPGAFGGELQFPPSIGTLALPAFVDFFLADLAPISNQSAAASHLA